MPAAEWQMCLEWLQRCRVLGQDFPVRDMSDFAQSLRDGVILCNLITTLVPTIEPNFSQRPQSQKMSQFLCLKNIRWFIQCCRSTFNMRQTDLFEPYDLFDLKDFKKVMNTLSRLSITDIATQRATGFEHQEEDIYKNLEELQLEMPDEDNYGPIATEEEGDKIYEDLCSFKQNRSSVMSRTSTLEKKTKSDHCIEEILVTEKNYVDVLQLITEKFIRHLDPGVLNPDQITAIFMNIKELYETHKDIYSKLKTAVEQQGPDEIAGIFINAKKKMVLYAEYCAGLPTAQNKVDDLMKRNEIIRLTIQDCEQQANEGRFKLRDLLVVPMRRVMKYSLLLHELKKNLDKDKISDKSSHQMKQIDRAIAVMQDLALYVNEVKRDRESLETISMIEQSIEDLAMPPGTKLDDYGHLLKDGELKVRFHDENKELRRYIFLFDKVMLMCKSKGDTYSYKTALVLHNYKLEDVQEGPTKVLQWKHSFMLVENVNNSAITFFCKNEEQKRKWLDSIVLAMDNFSPKSSKENGFDFIMHTFTQATECDYCDKLLAGCFYQGYLCTRNKKKAHKHCIANIVNRKATRRSIPPIIGKAEVSFDYSSTEPNQINLATGEMVAIISKAGGDRGWWKGAVIRGDGLSKIGYFPLAYVEETDDDNDLDYSLLLSKDTRGNNLLHMAAADNHTSFINKALSEQHITEINCALNMKNSDGPIPYNHANDHEVQKPLCDQLNNAEFELYDLDNPEDDLVVTAVVMTTKSDGRVYTLFKLIAGEIVDSPETDEEDLRVVTVCMNNDLLHDMITHECDVRFISILEESKRPKWQQHCPYFIVTPEAPHYDDSGSIILIDRTIDGKNLQGSDGSIFDFTHPANKEVGFRILEPASPPQALIMAPKFHGKPKPSHPMEKKESTRMHPDVQKLLAQEQRKLISALCQHREHDGNSQDAVTAVVWATLTVNEITREKGRPQTGVVLVNGILLGMKNSILDGDNSAGRIVNLKWFHSRGIRAKIPENKCLNIDPDLLISEGEICMTDAPGDGEAGTLTVEAKQQSVRVKFGHGPPWDFHKLNSQQILNPIPTYLPFENASDELAKVLPEIDGASIDRNVGEVVVSVHETIAPTSSSPANFRFRRDLFILLAKGNREDINLPNTFTYRDPLHLWVVQTWLENGNPQIWSLIHNNRPLQRPDDCSVAEHILLHKAADEECAKTLELTYKEGFRIKNKKLPLESWSHGPNDKSLKHELQQNIGFQRWKSGLKLNIQSCSLEQQVKDEFPIDLQNLPESFKHPTIQFSMKNLPGPNQMGMGIQTEKLKEFAATTVARDDHQVREVRPEQLFNPEQELKGVAAIGKQIGKVSAANTKQKVTPKDRQPDHDIKMIPAATSEFAIIVEDNSQETGTKPKCNYKSQGYGSSSNQPYQSKSSKRRHSIRKPGCLAIPDGKDISCSSAPGQKRIAPRDACAFPGMLPALSPKICDNLYDSNDNEAHFKFVNSSVYDGPGSHKGKEQLMKRITELIRNNKL